VRTGKDAMAKPVSEESDTGYQLQEWPIYWGYGDDNSVCV
jgi:hypothetical protein